MLNKIMRHGDFFKKKKKKTRRGDFLISHLGLDLRFQLKLNLQALCIKNSWEILSHSLPQHVYVLSGN